MFSEVAVSRPGAEAVSFGNQRLSYGQLESRSNQLARHLRKRGVGLETRVGICLERSLDLVVGLLGIVKAGGAYVPLDPEYPQERLRFMARDADVAVLVTDESLAGRAGRQRLSAGPSAPWTVAVYLFCCRPARSRSTATSAECRPALPSV